RTFIQERLRRPRRLRPRLLVTLFRGDPVIRRHPLARSVVSDDARAGSRKYFVVARLVEVVVRIEERLDLGRCCETLQRAGERVTRLWRAAVHQHETFTRREHDDVTATGLDNAEVIGQTSNASGRLLSSAKQRGCPKSEHAGHSPFPNFSPIHLPPP